VERATELDCSQSIKSKNQNHNNILNTNSDNNNRNSVKSVVASVSSYNNSVKSTLNACHSLTAEERNRRITLGLCAYCVNA
jgi:hypothetical protein